MPLPPAIPLPGGPHRARGDLRFRTLVADAFQGREVERERTRRRRASRCHRHRERRSGVRAHDSPRRVRGSTSCISFRSRRRRDRYDRSLPTSCEVYLFQGFFLLRFRFPSGVSSRARIRSSFAWFDPFSATASSLFDRPCARARLVDPLTGTLSCRVDRLSATSPQVLRR